MKLPMPMYHYEFYKSMFYDFIVRLKEMAYLEVYSAFIYFHHKTY